MEPKTDLSLALEVVAMLHGAGVQCVIAGGSARDVLLGREPKDYDIVIIGNRDCSEDVVDLLSNEDIDFQTYGVECDEYTGDNAQSSHLLWVIKMSYAHLDIDIIQQKRFPMCAEQVVEGFDVTLNMAWFESDGTVCNHPRFPEPGRLVEVLRDCDLPARRIPYLAEKFPGYQWPNMNKGS